MKRFLADIQSGLMGATISESYEMTHSNGKSQAQHSGTGGPGFGSRLASRLGMSTNASQMRSTIRSRDEKGNQNTSQSDEWYGARSQGNSGKTGAQIAETESVKGLTDHAIHQRMDYHVEFEDTGGMEAESRTSDRKARFQF